MKYASRSIIASMAAAASPGSGRWAASASASRSLQALDDLLEGVQAEPDELAIDDLLLHPSADDRAVAAIGGDELREPRPQLRLAGLVGRDRTERLGQRLHLLGALASERAEQVLLVGEVEIEGAVRQLRHPDDVVDAGRVVAPLGQHLEPGVEQLRHRAAALRAQLAVARRRAGRTAGCGCHGRLSSPLEAA